MASSVVSEVVILGGILAVLFIAVFWMSYAEAKASGSDREASLETH